MPKGMGLGTRDSGLGIEFVELIEFIESVDFMTR
jgi:hypothetical protein